VRRLFEQKKNTQDYPYHHPERKRPNVCKFTRKKWKMLTRFSRRAGGPGRTFFLPEFPFRVVVWAVGATILIFFVQKAWRSLLVRVSSKIMKISILRNH
jgi:hypothetical protein